MMFRELGVVDGECWDMGCNAIRGWSGLGMGLVDIASGIA